MRTEGRLLLGLVVVAWMLLPLPVAAQDHGGGGGGGEGCGDVLGDLIHILRDASTGQPILQQRWIEYPQDTFDWGYCPIPVDAAGNEIPFADLSCDPHPDYLDAVVEVDYFGRLSGGRTKERNSRMHFNEVISSIKDSGRVGQDETGRLMLGYDCTAMACATWAVIDSPMENLALYTRLMKYGHFQTDPLEVDLWAKGDPAAGTQYHPALAPEDWAKFIGSAKNLLPMNAKVEACFGAAYDNGFNVPCAEPESLDSRDFKRAAASLAGAANKTGKITADLVQYMNRILKIPLNTTASKSNPDTLPALIRTEDKSAIFEAGPDLPAPADERFVDYDKMAYDRLAARNAILLLLRPLGGGTWIEDDGIVLADWLEFANGAPVPAVGFAGFLDASSDSLRSIEFVHNYAIPEDLGWDFGY